MQSEPRLSELTKIKLTKYIPHDPTPKQAAFLWLDCLDAFYGGAAGGGKSDALLMGALQYVDQPDYAAILIRDTYKNLSMPKSLMDRANEWLRPTDAHWDGDKKAWRFPSGASLSFGYLDGPNDHFNYQSAEFQFVGIDEIVNIREHQAKYMFSRLRRLEGSTIPVRFRSASNPPAAEQLAKGSWVKNRYVNVKTRREGVVFISAGLDDNPYLDKETYIQSLQELDPVTRAQLLEGDWEVRAKGRMFSREWFEVVKEAPVINIGEVRYWDLAATEEAKEGKQPAYTAGSKLCKTEFGIYYIKNMIRLRRSSRQVEQLIRQTADVDGKAVKVMMEQEPGSSGKNVIDYYRRKIIPDYIFKEDKVSGSKIQRAELLRSQAEAGNVKIVEGYWNEDFLEEIEVFPDGEFKDQADATSGAFNELAGYGVEAKIRRV